MRHRTEAWVVLTFLLNTLFRSLIYVMSPSSSLFLLRENFFFLSMLRYTRLHQGLWSVDDGKVTYSALILPMTLSIASSLGLLSAYNKLFASRYKLSAASRCSTLVGAPCNDTCISLQRATCMNQSLRTDGPPWGLKLVIADEDELDPCFDNVPGAKPKATSFCLLYAARSGLM